MSDHAHAHGHHGTPSYSHPMPPWILLSTFFALVFFTAVTVAQSYLALGDAEIYVAMTIATIKALLVLVFFMHVRHEKAFNILIILFSLVFVAVFIGFCTMDSMSYQNEIDARVLDTPK